MLAIAVLSAGHGAGAQSRPLFQLPFTCNEEWEGHSYAGHTSFYESPGDLPVDFDHERGNAFERGRPVVASAAGRVTRTQAVNGVVELDHGGGWTTLYGHMDTTVVVMGATVQQGTQIGTVGARGTAADHLHYEQALDGSAQVPTFNGETFYYHPDGRTPLVSRNCAGGGVSPTPPARAGDLAPTADYRFAGDLRSSIGSPPELEALGSGGAFSTESVDGTSRSVYRFPAGSGLQLRPTCGVVWDGNYSIVMLVRLDSVSGYRRIVDWRAGKSDRGLYVNSGRVTFWGQNEETPNAVVAPGVYVQLVVTRDEASNTVTTYVNGASVWHFAYTTDIAVLDLDRTLRFFFDDALQPGDNASGAIARLRLYDQPLTAAEVAALDELPTTDASEPAAPSPPSCEMVPGPTPTGTISPSPSPQPSPTATPTPPQNGGTQSCGGLTATLVGSAASEAITGSAGDDVIAAKGGDDAIRGLGGNDVVCGGGGRDRVEGGGGRDAMYGQGSADSLIGGSGRDRAVGGRGRDRCRAETTSGCET